MEDFYSPHSRHHKSNKIHDTAIIYDNVQMGKNNIIGAYTIIGSNGEIRGKEHFEGAVIIGDNNVISELVTIQRPAEQGQKTIIGDDNLIMAHTHVGHNAEVGNGCELSTRTLVGGYAKIEDGAKIKLGCIIRNRVTVGKNALVGMGSNVIKSITPGKTAVGNPAKEIN